MTSPSQPYVPLVSPPAMGELTGMAHINAALHNVLELWSQDIYRPGCTEDRVLGQKVVTVSDPDVVKEVLHTNSKSFRRSRFNKKILRPALGHSLLTTDGEDWRRQRKILASAFSPQSLRTLVPAIAHLSDDLALRLAENGGSVVDIMQEMLETTYQIILVMLFGQQQSKIMNPEVLRAGETYLEILGKVELVDLLPLVGPIASLRKWKGYRAGWMLRREIRDTLERLNVEEQASEGTLAGLLLNAREPDTGAALSNKQIVDNLMGIAAAGHHTTALTLTWALHCLSHQPELWAELGEEARRVVPQVITNEKQLAGMHLHEQVILETMRLFPPVPALRREACERTQVGPYTLAPGDIAQIAIYPMQRSEELWDAPAEFRADRFSAENRKKMHRYQYVPFGIGPHICIGMTLAMWEMKIILSTLTRRLSFLPAMEQEDILPVVAVTLRPENGLKLKVA